MATTDPCNCTPLDLADVEELNDVNEQLVCQEAVIIGGTAPCDLPVELEEAWAKLCCMNKSYNNILIQMKEKIDILDNIINNLIDGGAMNPDGTFPAGKHIAYGNINLFGGTQDGNSFIRTNKGSTENDITAGIN
ncbi:hypothetical protein [Lactococcus allomyrinae]|uniref:Uncharacterized protein n=1 Tax=Lactococcus allomyrinae TaxID=2419773 RepID=A0A387BL30_9LACT|nr:hypothetical protein [Lactococcus allomyrinae]AYG01716.1 hypothetical protein D7I46_12015 [Lactococcus allomyrinae]